MASQQMKHVVRPTRRPTRRGVQILEFILALPILVIVTMAALQFGSLAVVQHTVSHAANEAAREAAKLSPGTTPQQRADYAATVANAILAMHNVAIDPDNRLVLQDGDDPGNDGEVGDPTLPFSATPAPDLGQIRVIVVIELVNTPVLNVLASFGLDWSDTRYEVSAIAWKQ